MITVGVLTISDSGAVGAREDTSGEQIRAMVTAQIGPRCHFGGRDYSR